MTIIISIEGNIGSGKSTFLKYLKDHLTSDKICFLDEPVDDWLSIKDTNDKNIIERYYGDQKKYAFPFQMLAYISRLSLLKKALHNNTYNYIITERSLFTDRNVFCKMLYDDNLIEKIEYTIYNKWFDEFNINEDIIYVYLKCNPNTANDRVIHRNRRGEIIPIDYLVKCHNYHENWLKNETTIVLDANKSNDKIYDTWLDEIKKLLI
jgi:deoxyadenosine/deoxycytidine kinase